MDLAEKAGAEMEEETGEKDPAEMAWEGTSALAALGIPAEPVPEARTAAGMAREVRTEGEDTAVRMEEGTTAAVRAEMREDTEAAMGAAAGRASEEGTLEGMEAAEGWEAKPLRMVHRRARSNRRSLRS